MSKVWLKSSMCEKDFNVLVCYKVNMFQQRHAEKANDILKDIKRSMVSRSQELSHPTLP